MICYENKSKAAKPTKYRVSYYLLRKGKLQLVRKGRQFTAAKHLKTGRDKLQELMGFANDLAQVGTRAEKADLRQLRLTDWTVITRKHR
jgi:hypothetical protein